MPPYSHIPSWHVNGQLYVFRLIVCTTFGTSGGGWLSPRSGRFRPGKRRGRVKTERDGTRAETRFGLPAKRTSPFISAGVSVQSSTGFLGVRVGGERL